MDWLTPVLSSAAIVTVLELIKWRMGVNAENTRARHRRETDIEDEYRGDLKQRVTALESRLEQQQKDIDIWKQKYFQLEAQHKILEIQHKAEFDKRQQLEWKVKDLEAQLTIEPQDLDTGE